MWSIYDDSLEDLTRPDEHGTIGSDLLAFTVEMWQGSSTVVAHRKLGYELLELDWAKFRRGGNTAEGAFGHCG